MSATATRPRIGFLGLGWIGKSRMDALLGSGIAECAGVADPALPDAFDSLEELLEGRPDAVVIATPSALHAEHAVQALAAGAAVFCQKPLGRDAAETEAVVEVAKSADRLLGVDLSYRATEAARRCRELVAGDELGDVYAAELTFHNAYGPDKAWYYDPALSGGGCLVDLGSHLVDLLLWIVDANVAEVNARLVHHRGLVVEDYATAHLELDNGAVVSMSCSWNLPAGRDAVIEAVFYGTRGGVRLHNVNGSFYDLRAERCDGTSAESLVEPPDDWGGRALIEWASRLALSPRYDPEIVHVVETARVLDRMYGRKT
ncbi:MAG: Gfo/Idh/MocA family protein [Gaiellaceae bacterium]